MKKIKAYQCGFCDKIYLRYSSCYSHEKKCFYNPATKSCRSCANFLIEDRYNKDEGFFEDIPICKARVLVSWKKLRNDCEKYSVRLSIV
jgi:hypothetical protein